MGRISVFACMLLFPVFATSQGIVTASDTVVPSLVNFSGTVTDVMNMAGALAASFTPLIFGYYFGKGSWMAPFFITSGVMLISALIWTFLINPERSVVETPR